MGRRPPPGAPGCLPVHQPSTSEGACQCCQAISLAPVVLNCKFSVGLSLWAYRRFQSVSELNYEEIISVHVRVPAVNHC